MQHLTPEIELSEYSSDSKLSTLEYVSIRSSPTGNVGADGPSGIASPGSTVRGRLWVEIRYQKWQLAEIAGLTN